MKRLKYIHWIFIGLGIYMLSGCKQANKNYPGSEYMPDMFHSIAFEANLYDYYYYNTWSSPEEYYKNAQPRKPVAGTVPFGQFAMKDGQYSDEMQKVMVDLPANGHVPFHYPDTEEGRANAIADITKNPFPITEEALATGKGLYGIYCGICHGQKGDGLGYLVREDGGKYPVAPADLLADKFIDTTAGLYIFTIIHGKNVMGSYADKLSTKERWDVIHHIRELQAGKAGKKYTPEINTFVPSEAITAKQAGELIVSMGSDIKSQNEGMKSSDQEDSGDN